MPAVILKRACESGTFTDCEGPATLLHIKNNDPPRDATLCAGRLTLCSALAACINFLLVFPKMPAEETEEENYMELLKAGGAFRGAGALNNTSGTNRK